MKKAIKTKVKKIININIKKGICKNLWICYSNNFKKFHQEEDKPSVIYFNGYICFYKIGRWHRKGNPTIIYSDGKLEYWEDNKLVKKIEI